MSSGEGSFNPAVAKVVRNAIALEDPCYSEFPPHLKGRYLERDRGQEGDPLHSSRGMNEADVSEAFPPERIRQEYANLIRVLGKDQMLRFNLLHPDQSPFDPRTLGDPDVGNEHTTYTTGTLIHHKYTPKDTDPDPDHEWIDVSRENGNITLYYSRKLTNGNETGQQRVWLAIQPNGSFNMFGSQGEISLSPHGPYFILASARSGTQVFKDRVLRHSAPVYTANSIRILQELLHKTATVVVTPSPTV